MAQTRSPTSIIFKVQRSASELITPAKPTPYESKPLSNIDNQKWFQIKMRVLLFYPHNPSMTGVDPAKLIKKAIAETLVFYYPLAGRLREGPTGKLIVECTADGILFTEADAYITLDQFDFPLVPPFSFLEQLLYEEPGSSDLLNRPLLQIQVTRLNCGGFTFCFCSNHPMSDAAGLMQFISAIGQIARGATSPSVLPVWERHIFSSKNPQQLKFPLPDIPGSTNDLKFPLEHDLACKAFIFGPLEISALRRSLPLHIRDCSSFELLTAYVWKCRVVALEPHPTEQMSLIWAVNLRKLNHFIPAGYYGNAVGVSISTSTAKEIMENPLSYTLQLLKNAKEKVNSEDDYDGSIYNLMVRMSSYALSDVRYVGYDHELDFGWGGPMYGGLSNCDPSTAYFQKPPKKEKEENYVMLPVCLPKRAMERFEMEINNLLKYDQLDNNTVISKL